MSAFGADPPDVVNRPGSGKGVLAIAETSLGKVPWPAQPDSALISADGRHVVFPVIRGNRHSVRLDGVDGTPYDSVRFINFSPDGQRLAYHACRGDKCMVVVDGREGPGFDGIGGAYAVFSPNSRRVAYAGGRRGKSEKILVIVDGKEGPEMDEIMGDGPIFSPDSEHIAYDAKRGTRKFVVLDGKEGPHFDEVHVNTLKFSPDSRSLAYMAGLNHRKGIPANLQRQSSFHWPANEVVASLTLSVVKP